VLNALHRFHTLPKGLEALPGGSYDTQPEQVYSIKAQPKNLEGIGRQPAQKHTKEPQELFGAAPHSLQIGSTAVHVPLKKM
jgi:hypothetical protein